MGIIEQDAENEQCFVIHDDLSQEMARELYEKMIECLNKGVIHLRLDLKNCGFISSSGLGTIAAVTMVARSRKGDLKVSGVQTNVRNLFNITRLDQIIEIE